MRLPSFTWRTFALATSLASAAGAQSAPPDAYLPIGLFFGRMEEGARIFTPARLLPFEHPEALGHEFPTLLRLHATEFPALLWLGRQAGLQLWATLQRYPREPSPDWPYDAYRPPPDTLLLREIPIRRMARDNAPLPGLRAVLFHDRQLVLFIVDTRDMSLEQRGMRVPTTMGLDLTRAQFLDLVGRAGRLAPERGFGAVIVDP